MTAVPGLNGAAARRAVAGLLLLLALLPGYRLLDSPASGIAGARTLELVRQFAGYVWSGTLLLLLGALLLARFVTGTLANGLLDRLGARLRSPRTVPYTAGCALAAFLFAWFVNRQVFAGQPNVIDAVTQLVQARYVAAGRLAGPASPLSAFWHLPLMLVTPAGWVSQYPPVHVLLLGLGLKLHAVEFVGPILLAATVFVAGLLWHRLLPADPAVARVGTLLLALSPFAVAHAAAYMNHTTAAFLSVSAAYAAVRLTQGGRWYYAALLGVSLAALFATRPLTAVVLAAVLGGAWLVAGRRSGRLLPRPALLLTSGAAALPLLLLLGFYNQRFFGSPFRFGYEAAFGPAVGMGFGVDPWNNYYGVRQALGYTSAELAALNVFLLETPVPVVAVIALFLLLARRLESALRFCVAWALLPLAAHALYWHHGLLMGPRMLNEYAPVWCLLAAAAAVGLARLAPSTFPGFLPAWSPRVFVVGLLFGAAGFAAIYGAPRRLASYRQQPAPVVHAAARLEPPALVFVHGTWATRVAMQLAAGGMRMDSVENAMRGNSTCAIQRWLERSRPAGALDFHGAPARALVQVEIAPGSHVWMWPGETLAPECRRQARADRFGVLEIGTFIWREALPGLETNRTLFARDLGPAADLRLIQALGRPAYLLHLDAASGRPVLWPYAEAIRMVWGDSLAPVARLPGSGRPTGSLDS